MSGNVWSGHVTWPPELERDLEEWNAQHPDAPDTEGTSDTEGDNATESAENSPPTKLEAGK